MSRSTWKVDLVRFSIMRIQDSVLRATKIAYMAACSQNFVVGPGARRQLDVKNGKNSCSISGEIGPLDLYVYGGAVMRRGTGNNHRIHVKGFY